MTQFPSKDVTVKNILISLAFLSIIIGINTVYKKAALEFTFSDAGITLIQKSTNKMTQDFLNIETELGGGRDLIGLAAFSFIFFKRERFFYFLFVYALYAMFIGELKLAYAEPRPYMVDGKIIPLEYPWPW